MAEAAGVVLRSTLHSSRNTAASADLPASSAPRPPCYRHPPPRFSPPAPLAASRSSSCGVCSVASPGSAPESESERASRSSAREGGEVSTQRHLSWAPGLSGPGTPLRHPPGLRARSHQPARSAACPIGNAVAPMPQILKCTRLPTAPRRDWAASLAPSERPSGTPRPLADLSREPRSHHSECNGSQPCGAPRRAARRRGRPHLCALARR